MNALRRRICPLGFALAIAVLLSPGADAKTADRPLPPVEKVGPPFEIVKAFGSDFRLVGIGVSHQGRVFATAPAGNVRSRYSMIEVNSKTGAVTPFPDASWNTFTEHPNERPEWVSVQALWVDRADHLWALDSSLPNVDQTTLPPKLVEFDITTNKVIRQYGFTGVVTPTDSLNDVRIDLIHGYAYLTNAANKGSLVVLNLKSGQSRQVLVDDKSTHADPKQHLMFGDQVALRPNGSVTDIEADGIALSPDASWLYYRPLTDHNYWRVPTAALRDEQLSAGDLASKVQFLGQSVMSGGMIMDSSGTLYAGDIEHRTVVAMRVDAGTDKTQPRLQTRVYASDPKRLSWADGFAISGGYLYVADSRLWEVAFKNNYAHSGPFRILKVKLPGGDD